MNGSFTVSARPEARTRILQGARHAFARKGLSATMADVANAAGVSQGLAYRYFENKNALLLALIEQAVQGGRAAIEEILHDEACSPGARLFDLISGVLESRRREPELFLLLRRLREESAPARINELIDGQASLFIAATRRLLIEAQACGEAYEGDADQMVTALIACLEGLTSLAVLGPSSLEASFPDPKIVSRMLCRTAKPRRRKCPPT
jgi:AcrR family transcriptional regulator